MKRPDPTNLSPQLLLSAYSQGAFPMTDPDGVTRFYSTDPRGVLPLDGFHCPRTLRQWVKQDRYQIRIDQDFAGTMRGCMDVPRPETNTSWISDELIAAYVRLYELGFAHSVEAYQDNQLVGGLYGVSLGRAFFGESMFSRERDASKVCLAHLVEHLHARGFELLDTQFTTEHLKRFGAVDVPRARYERMLADALSGEAKF